MAKDKTLFVCEYCGQESLKWVGKCPSCGKGNTMKEFKSPARTSSVGWKTSSCALPSVSGEGVSLLRNIVADSEPRIDMGDAELNRVLGGGLVPGSLVLLGGEPGIGKSTLVLQTVLRLADKKVLYVSGEESARQIKLRADRLRTSPQTSPAMVEGQESDLLILTETSLEQIFTQIEQTNPDLVIID